YLVEAGTALTPGAGQGVLANDSGGPLAFFSCTNPLHGSLTLNADGTFTYTPNPGFFGQDTFDYTVSNAVKRYSLHLFPPNVPPLATNIGGVNLSGGAYGPSVCPVPGTTNEYSGLTDRGPNVNGPNGTKVEPLPSFTPQIARFKLVEGQAVMQGGPILLKGPD